MITIPYMGNGWMIRPLERTDLPIIASIETQSFPTPMSVDTFNKHLDQCRTCTYFVIEKEQNVIGYIGILHLVDEVHIRIIAVAKAERGKGYGELLLLYGLLWSAKQNPELATLEVRKSNLIAQSLYEKIGFIKVGIRPRYYRDTNEDAIIMTVAPFNSDWITQLQSHWQDRLH